MYLLEPQNYVLMVLVGAVVLIVSDRLRADLVALLVLLALALGNVLTPEEAFSGFARPAILTLAGLFVITAAMDRAGIVHWMVERLERTTGGSETKMIAVFMLAGAALSLAMNTIAAGTVLLPAAVSVARRKQVPASRILMPLGFGVILGGTATIFTTANIIMSGILQGQGHPGLTMSDFLPTGGVLVAAGTAYMVFLGRKLLPRRKTAGREAMSTADLTEVYHMNKRLWEVRIESGSPLIGQTLAELELEVTVLAIWRERHAHLSPGRDEVLQAEDMLLVSAPADEAGKFSSLHTTLGRSRRAGAAGLPVLLVEVVIPPRSHAVGRTLRELRFRNRQGLTVVALWRGGKSHRSGLGDCRLRAGDALLMVGPLQKILDLTDHPDYLVVDTPTYAPVSRTQCLLTLMIAGCVLAAAGLGLITMSLAALAGAVLLVLTRTVTLDQAYSAIEWRVLMLIAGMSPLALALEQTGWTTWVGQSASGLLSPYGPLFTVGGFYLLTVAAAQIMGSQVTALLLGPTALAVVTRLGVDPTAAAVVISIACSNAFLTPISHPVNALVQGPGGYSSGDFLKTGLGLTVVSFLGAMGMAHFYWGI